MYLATQKPEEKKVVIQDQVFDQILEWGIGHEFTTNDFVDILKDGGAHRKVSVGKALRDLVDTGCLVVHGRVPKTNTNIHKVVSLDKGADYNSGAVPDLGIWTDLFMNPVPFPSAVRSVRFDKDL